MTDLPSSIGPACLCGCQKSEHRQGRKSCLKCDCAQYESAEVDASSALHDMEVAFHTAERELKGAREVLGDIKHAAGLVADYPDANLPGFVVTLHGSRNEARDHVRQCGEELAGALQRLAEYDSGASVDRLLHDADAIDLKRVQHAAAVVRSAASMLVDVLATAEQELALRAEAQRLRDEMARVDDELRRLVAGESVPDQPEPAEPFAEPAQADVRAWAKRQGYACPARGPIPGGVMEAYRRELGLVSL